MCIAAIAWNAHPRWRLLVAANRDEFHARPAAPLARWDDAPEVVAGRDLKGGGTWLGVHDAGRMVLVTNFRVPGYPKPDRPSRGGLVTGLLNGLPPETINLAPYNPFSLLVANKDRLHLLSNYPEESRIILPAGVHGLSNGAFANPWPKTRRLVHEIAQWTAQGSDDFSPLFAALRDESPHDSPGDGPGAGPEPRLSGVFIADPVYGTRCSTLVAIGHDGCGQMIERRFDDQGHASGETAISLNWGMAATD